jgi:hypothetical protein
MTAIPHTNTSLSSAVADWTNGQARAARLNHSTPATGMPCGSAATSQRAGRDEVQLPHYPFAEPDRQGQGTMGNEVEPASTPSRLHVEVH